MPNDAQVPVVEREIPRTIPLVGSQFNPEGMKLRSRAKVDKPQRMRTTTIEQLKYLQEKLRYQIQQSPEDLDINHPDFTPAVVPLDDSYQRGRHRYTPFRVQREAYQVVQPGATWNAIGDNYEFGPPAETSIITPLKLLVKVYCLYTRRPMSDADAARFIPERFSGTPEWNAIKRVITKKYATAAAEVKSDMQAFMVAWVISEVLSKEFEGIVGKELDEIITYFIGQVNKQGARVLVAWLRPVRDVLDLEFIFCYRHEGLTKDGIEEEVKLKAQRFFRELFAHMAAMTLLFYVDQDNREWLGYWEHFLADEWALSHHHPNIAPHEFNDVDDLPVRSLLAYRRMQRTGKPVEFNVSDSISRATANAQPMTL